MMELGFAVFLLIAVAVIIYGAVDEFRSARARREWTREMQQRWREPWWETDDARTRH